MSSIKMKEAQKRLVDDLANNPHILSAPLGHGVTQRKIYAYLFECVMEEVPKADCVDWLCDLYKEQSKEEKKEFQLIIDSVFVALMEFKNFLGMPKSEKDNGTPTK